MLAMLLLLAAAMSLADRACSTATDAAPRNDVRVWPQRHDPWANPHAHRHFVSTPRAFGNRTRFTSYRGVTATAAELDAVAALDLGDCIFPPLQFIWQPNATEVLRDIQLAHASIKAFAEAQRSSIKDVERAEGLPQDQPLRQLGAVVNQPDVPQGVNPEDVAVRLRDEDTDELPPLVRHSPRVEAAH